MPPLPPPVKTMFCIIAILLLDHTWPISVLSPKFAMGAAIIVAGCGLAIMLTAVAQFRYYRTTVNPYRPESTSKIVSTGIFAKSRNPMYLGMLLLVIAAAFYSANPIALLAWPLFVWNMNRYQIKPEEIALSRNFGHNYELYCQQVRRWV